MNLIDRIQQEMLSDTEDRDDQSHYLIQEYKTASPKTQQVMDAAFICLCGYSLNTLIETTK